VIVANQNTEEQPSNTITIIDVANFSAVNTIETGAGAHGVVIDPSGRFAYITNIFANTVSVVDIAAGEVVATIPTGEGPNGITFTTVIPNAGLEEEIPVPMPEHGEGVEPAGTMEPMGTMAPMSTP
jgi:YVTN family beta-propeller protein